MEKQLWLDVDREEMTGMDMPVSAHELADWLACTIKSITGLASHGVIKRTGPGRYPLKASIRRYAEHMRRVVTGRGERTPAEANGRLAPPDHPARAREQYSPVKQGA